MSYLILDADFLAYTVSAVFQETYILAKHPEIVEPVKLPNKTALWGKPPKREGGFVQEYNELNFATLKACDFTFTEHQEALCIKAAKKSIDTRIQGLMEETGAEYYKGFVGKGDLDRVAMSTLWKYKGNREGAMRPCHLTELKDYLVQEHNCVYISGRESDDAVAEAGLAAYNKWKVSRKDDDKGIITFADKDLCQVDGWQHHVGQCQKPELRVGFGKIWRDDKGKVRGHGRLHFYWQVMSSDDSDHYSASCFSDVKWGDVSAYKILADAKDDKQAFEALVQGFKKLYPTPKTVTGWRGDEIEIDGLYVMNECFNLAKMLRTADEKPTDVKAVMAKLGVAF